MTRHAESVLDDMDDLELITRMLNGQLDPERVEAVRKRLEEDASFRELAAPLLLTWTIPPHFERNPRPEGEWERDWSEFTRRPGFKQARRAPSRRRWVGWLAVVVIALVGTVVLTYREALGDLLMPNRGFAALPYDTGWIPLGDGIDVQLSSEAQLRVGERPVREMQQVMLVEGTARFRVAPFYPTARAPRRESIVVRTRAGLVTAGESEFTVTVSADTTEVVVHPLIRRGFLQSVQQTVTATAERQGETHHLPLNDLDHARLVLGRRPQLVTEQP